MYSIFILPFSFPVNRKVLKNQIEWTNMKTCKENSNHADENSTILGHRHLRRCREVSK